MNGKGTAIISLAALAIAGGLGLGGRQWAANHIERWSGRSDLGVVSCTHCHLTQIDKLPWAQPRPHHPSPTGLAVSPDGHRLYIAIDDTDELVEADAASRAVLRRIKLAGSPFAVLVHPDGQKLFVALRDQGARRSPDAGWVPARSASLWPAPRTENA